MSNESWKIHSRITEESRELLKMLERYCALSMKICDDCKMKDSHGKCLKLVVRELSEK